MQTLILKPSTTTTTAPYTRKTILRSTSTSESPQDNFSDTSQQQSSDNLKKNDTNDTNDVENIIEKITEVDTIVEREDFNKINNNVELETKKLLKQYGWKEEYNYFGIKFKAPLIWHNIIMIGLLHVFALVTYYQLEAKGHWTSIWWAVFVGGLAGFGVTAGAHRYWCHRSYKAKLPLQILLAIAFSASGQNTIPEWVRDHRVHHRFTETDADPHNSNRGFFFAHVGWLMMRKHPAVLSKGKLVDMSDIYNDPLIQLHTRYFWFLKFLFCFIIPTVIPVYCWGDDWYFSFCTQCLIRYACSLNFTWSVNSFAHLYGHRPYDNRINPVENKLVSFFAMGEGWHNYHHVFPWDYKAAEMPYTINITTVWLDVFAKLGWAYDMKQPSKELIKNVAIKHGDGTHSTWGHKEVPPPQQQKIKELVVDERQH